jgi:hypothetical protein
MKDRDEIERSLQALSRKPPPEGLRQRVLSAALREGEGKPALGPVFRTAAFVSCLVLALMLFSDPWVAGSENRRLSALLGRTPHSQPEAERGARELLSELGADDLERSLSRWMLQHSRIKERTARADNISQLLSRIWEEIDEDQD